MLLAAAVTPFLILLLYLKIVIGAVVIHHPRTAGKQPAACLIQRRLDIVALRSQDRKSPVKVMQRKVGSFKERLRQTQRGKL